MKQLLTALLLLTVGFAHAQENKQSKKLLRHVVLFSFKEGSTPQQLKAVTDAFAALPQKIKEIKDLPHPAHLAFIEVLKPILGNVLVIDYWTEK
jgi:hypothetical protein